MAPAAAGVAVVADVEMVVVTVGTADIVHDGSAAAAAAAAADDIPAAGVVNVVTIVS